MRQELLPAVGEMRISCLILPRFQVKFQSVNILGFSIILEHLIRPLATYTYTLFHPITPASGGGSCCPLSEGD